MSLATCPLVRGLDAFKGLSLADVADILTDARLRKIPEGSIAFAQGAPASRVFLLLDGQMKIVQVTQEGQQIIAHFIVPGQLFGLAVAMGRSDYPGTAVSVIDSTVLAWSLAAWERVALRHPALVATALRMVGGHLQEAFARLREVASARVEQRIANTLLRLIRQSGRKMAEGVQIEFPITRREIAEIASTTLYTVSRTFSAWEQAGILTGGRRRIIVLDPHALVTIAESE